MNQKMNHLRDKCGSGILGILAAGRVFLAAGRVFMATPGALPMVAGCVGYAKIFPQELKVKRNCLKSELFKETFSEINFFFPDFSKLFKKISFFSRNFIRDNYINLDKQVTFRTAVQMRNAFASYPEHAS